MAAFETGETVQVVQTIQRSSGAAWPGDRVTVVQAHSPWIGDDTFDVRTAGGELLTGVRAEQLTRA